MEELDAGTDLEVVPVDMSPSPPAVVAPVEVLPAVEEPPKQDGTDDDDGSTSGNDDGNDNGDEAGSFPPGYHPSHPFPSPGNTVTAVCGGLLCPKSPK